MRSEGRKRVRNLLANLDGRADGDHLVELVDVAVAERDAAVGPVGDQPQLPLAATGTRPVDADETAERCAPRWPLTALVGEPNVGPRVGGDQSGLEGAI